MASARMKTIGWMLTCLRGAFLVKSTTPSTNLSPLHDVYVLSNTDEEAWAASGPEPVA